MTKSMKKSPSMQIDKVAVWYVFPLFAKEGLDKWQASR